MTLALPVAVPRLATMPSHVSADDAIHARPAANGHETVRPMKPSHDLVTRAEAQQITADLLGPMYQAILHLEARAAQLEKAMEILIDRVEQFDAIERSP